MPQDKIKLRKQIRQLQGYLFSIWHKTQKKLPYLYNLKYQTHVQAGWMLTTISSVGELERMTQYKDKAQKRTDGIPKRITNLPTINGTDCDIQY